jgi:hypothetical protein
LPPLVISPYVKALSVALIAIMLVAGFYPYPLVTLAEAAARVLAF